MSLTNGTRGERGPHVIVRERRDATVKYLDLNRNNLKREGLIVSFNSSAPTAIDRAWELESAWGERRRVATEQKNRRLWPSRTRLSQKSKQGRWGLATATA